MPFLQNGVNISTRTAGTEPPHDGRAEQVYTGLKINGQPWATGVSTPLLVTIDGTFITLGNYFVSGKSIQFPLLNCRPHAKYINWVTELAGTYYIHRYSADNSIRVTSATTHDGSGTVVTTGRVIILDFCGGGAGGGGSTTSYGAGGGGGGGSAVCCVKLPENGYATLIVGAGGAGGAKSAAGSNGALSRLTCGNFTCTANGGTKGVVGALITSTAAGGSVTKSGSDGVAVTATGGSGATKNSVGGSVSLSFQFTPEDGTKTLSQSGGGAGAIAGRGGGGGSSAFGQGGYNNYQDNGGSGQGSGAGGAGGGIVSGTAFTGGNGIAGCARIWGYN
jgi:hypothetical protein